MRPIGYYIKAVLFLMVVNLITTNSASCLLMEINDSSGHVVYDTNKKQYWYWAGLYEFGFMTYSDQISSIAKLNEGDGYFGITSWHMANLSEIEDLSSHSVEELAYKIHPSYQYSTGDNSAWEEDQLWHKHWNGRIEEFLTNSTVDHAIAGFGASHPEPYGAINWKPFDMDKYAFGDDETDWHGAWVTSASIPEPATVLLIGTGLLGIALTRKAALKSQ